MNLENFINRKSTKHNNTRFKYSHQNYLDSKKGQTIEWMVLENRASNEYKLTRKLIYADTLSKMWKLILDQNIWQSPAKPGYINTQVEN